MLKTMLIVLIILGAAWAYQPSRERMLHAMHPVLVKLGPVGERIAAPAKRYQARSEIDFLIDQLELERDEARTLPDPRTFPQWIARKKTSDRDANDPWGTPYYMLMSDGGARTIGSAGEDRQRGTADDIRKTFPGGG